MSRPRRRERERVAPAEAEALAGAAAREAVDRTGRDVMVLDLRGLTSATDFFVLATGESDVQVRAIAERIEDRLKTEGARPWHVEGGRYSHWILMDYVDFVVHVFHREARAFYELERLWADAPVHEFPSPDEAGRDDGQD